MIKPSSRSMKSSQLYLDWLHSGVQTKVITLTEAFKLYKDKTKKFILLKEFEELLYDK
jgi:hypothetical protein